MNQISTIREFVLFVELQLINLSDASDVFEDQCTSNLRDLIYSFADPESNEPFRSAMFNLGFTEY